MVARAARGDPARDVILALLAGSAAVWLTALHEESDSAAATARAMVALVLVRLNGNGQLDEGRAQHPGL